MGFLLLLASGQAVAADGDLDPGWGSNGLIAAGSPGTDNEGLGVALQCDGKVVAVGSINGDGAEHSELGVVRFNSDGTPDLSFASDGIFNLSFGLYDSFGADVAVQPDGKIIVAGEAFIEQVPGPSGQHFVVIRLLENGVLDPTFAGNGVTYFEFGEPSIGHAVAVQDDGRIVVVGETSYTSAMAIARLTDDGQLDPTFGTDGKVLVDFTVGADAAWDVVIQHDGRIVIAGTAALSGGSVVAVVRLLSDGSLDPTFGPGAGGASALDFGTFSQGRSVALQTDGKIVVAGFTDSQTSMAVGRLTADGILDPTFDGDGMVTRDFLTGSDEAWGVAMQLDGRIVVTGSVMGATKDLAAIVSFMPDGSVDTSFGIDGATLMSFSSNAWGRDLVVQPNDGKIVMVGSFEFTSTDSRITVARFVGDESLIFASNFECGDTSAWSQ